MTNSSLENIVSSNIFNLETKQENSLLETSISLQNKIRRKIQNDFTTNHIEPLTRISSLSQTLFNKQLNEIVFYL